MRTKEEVAKKWSNVLAKHKPLISEKMYLARKTGGGSPEAELTELEAKVKSIKGKELFVGVVGGIDIITSPLSPLSDSDMSISEVIQPPRKRKFIDEKTDPIDQIKEALLENEQEKIALLRSIDQKMDCMVNLLGQLVSIHQNKLLANTTPQMHPHYGSNPPTFLPPLPPQVYSSTSMHQHFPSSSNDV